MQKNLLGNHGNKTLILRFTHQILKSKKTLTEKNSKILVETPNSQTTQKKNKKRSPQQIQTHNMPINDIENINCTNKGRDLGSAN